MAKYDISVKLVGEDGNAFAILGATQRALRKAGASENELNQYLNEATAGNYDKLLQVTMDWVNVE